jgi:hypothetical protein
VRQQNPESQQEDFEWIFRTRYDAKQKAFPDDAIAIPDGPHPTKFQKHAYCFLSLPKDKVVGKGKKKSHQGPDAYAAIAVGLTCGALPDPNDPNDSTNCHFHISVEWVGRKHQGNMDNLDADHGLYVHGSSVVDLPERSWEAMQTMAQTVSIEGVVFYDAVFGERFKLRFGNFGDSLFKKNCKLPVSGESTSLKPNVIVAAEASASPTNDIS